MREGWEYKKLGEVATYINGYAFKPEQWKVDGTPIIRIQNLNNPDAPYNYYEGEVPDKVKVYKGDLLISWSASLGAYIWEGETAYLNQHIFKVYFDKSNIDKMYLKYAVSSKLDVMIGQVHGATMKHIVKKDFDNTLIPYPHITMQLSIVSELDKITEMISKYDEQLKELDKLSQSIFYEMFGDPVENEKGWEVKKLEDVCVCITDGDHMPPPKADYGVPFVTISNINKEKRMIDFSNTYYVPREYFDKIQSTRKPQIGDVLYTVTGSYGIPIYIDYETEFCFQRHIGLLRPSVSVSSIFLYEWALNKGTKYQADNVATGIAQKTVSLKSLRNFDIILPPLPLQQSFARKIEAIEAMKSKVREAKKEAETLLAARMQYWFE